MTDIEIIFKQLYEVKSLSLMNPFTRLFLNGNDEESYKAVYYTLSHLEDEECYKKIHVRFGIYNTLSSHLGLNKSMAIAVKNDYWTFAKYLVFGRLEPMTLINSKIKVRGSVMKKFHDKFYRRLLYNSRRELHRHIAVLRIFDNYTTSEDYEYVFEYFTKNPYKYRHFINGFKSKNLNEEQINTIQSLKLLIQLR